MSVARLRLTTRMSPGGWRRRPSRPRARGEDHPLLVWGLRGSGLAVVALAWEIWARAERSLLVPDFTSTMGAVWELMSSGVIWEPLFVSNQAMVVGFLLAIVTAIPLGLLMARLRTAESFADVYLNILMVTPMAALIPIFMMAMGLDLSSRAAVVYVFAAPVVVVNTRAGVRSVDPNLVDMARTFGANELQIWRKVLLPASMPAMMTGVRLGLSRAINGMVLAEMLLMAVGVGKLILDFRGALEPAPLFGVIVILMFESVLLMFLARSIEQRATPWAALGGVK